MRPPQARRDDVFDAGQFGSLRYDFKKFGGVAGLIPDPSDEMIERFMRRLREITREFGADEDLEGVDVENASAEELQRLLDDAPDLQLVDAQQAMCEAFSELCQGSPNADALLALPLRVRSSFFGWLQRKLLSGEASAADTSDAPVRRVGG